MRARTMRTLDVHKPLVVAMLVAACLTLISNQAQAGHPSPDGMEMAHPAMPLPEAALVPEIRFEVLPDMMDGYNLLIETKNFAPEIPAASAAASSPEEGGLRMRGHIHLYVNGQKKMRIYGDKTHLPVEWLNPGINSITLSVNNHMHGTFTYLDREIQSTIVIDGNAEELVRSVYSWPKVSTDELASR